MFVNNSPTEIILGIMSFLDNKTNTKLVRTCKSFHNHGKKFGYLTQLKVNNIIDKIYYLNIYLEHSKCLTTIEMNGFENPHLLLPRYVYNIKFDHCSISKYLDPGKQIYETEKITLKDYHRYKNKLTLQVNWSRFPNLKELQLYVYDVDLTGITELKKLKKININTVVKKIV